jgi:predicted deacylase
VNEMVTTPARTDFSAVSRLYADIDLEAEGKACGFLRVPHSVHRSAYGWIPIPIVRLRNGDGPRVVLIAGNHGDEWEGQLGLGELIRKLEPSQIKGRLIILPSANFPAAMAATRTSPIDGSNMNRAYPGDQDGDITHQIAFWIEHVLLPGNDYAIDLHSGGSSLMYTPSALMTRERDGEDTYFKRCLDLMEAFGAPVSYIAAAPQGGGRTFSSACRRNGIVVIGTELGGAGSLSQTTMEVARSGLLRALSHVGLLQKDVPIPPPRKTRLTELGGDDYYVYASDPGVYEPLVEPGDEVEANQPAARIHLFDVPWREPVLLKFARAGLVLCKRQPARCERGDCLFHLGTDVAG